MKKSKKYILEENTSNYFERLYFICESYKSFLSILIRAHCDDLSNNYCEMIEKYKKEYQNYYIEFKIAINTLINNLLGFIPKNVNYSFNFNRREVVFEWN